MNELLLPALLGPAGLLLGYLAGKVQALRQAVRLLPSVVCHSCDYAERQVPWFTAIQAWRHHAEYTHHNVELQAGGRHV